jgi:GTP-binding protein
VLLIDSRRGVLEQDLQLLEWLNFYGKERLIVLTKTDKLNRSELLSCVKQTSETLSVDSDSLVLFSAKTGEGKDRILRWIEGAIK